MLYRSSVGAVTIVPTAFVLLLLVSYDFAVSRVEGTHFFRTNVLEQKA
jgi:hypothetical protein